MPVTGMHPGICSPGRSRVFLRLRSRTRWVPPGSGPAGLARAGTARSRACWCGCWCIDNAPGRRAARQPSAIRVGITILVMASIVTLRMSKGPVSHALSVRASSTETDKSRSSWARVRGWSFAYPGLTPALKGRLCAHVPGGSRRHYKVLTLALQRQPKRQGTASARQVWRYMDLLDSVYKKLPQVSSAAPNALYLHSATNS
jgi:hypothetical protein